MKPNLKMKNKEKARHATVKTRTPRKWRVSSREQDHDALDSAPAEPTRGDTLQLYLNEIGQVKLITPQEEIQLARRIKKGDQRAREQMITANLRLVVKIARDYENLGLPLLDLINEGNIGLMKGVERFDPKKGAKLSTYAAWWIKQSMMAALANQSKTIRLPATSWREWPKCAGPKCNCTIPLTANPRTRNWRSTSVWMPAASAATATPPKRPYRSIHL